MPRPPLPVAEKRKFLVQVTLNERELDALDALRRDKQSRADAMREAINFSRQETKRGPHKE